ncbi:hypothetical protein BTVI_92963 [Pitangus sulphuratus]|nr:hypothetical protein BTVI_92963 [Pitangus sulphuratus]
MDGESSPCGFGSIDLVINNAMNPARGVQELVCEGFGAHSPSQEHPLAMLGFSSFSWNGTGEPQLGPLAEFPKDVSPGGSCSLLELFIPCDTQAGSHPVDAHPPPAAAGENPAANKFTPRG